MKKKTDILIVGTGVGGLFCALNLPGDKEVLMITKDEAENSDSYLAQGGICMLRSESDYDSYYEDTMRAGHYKNREESVDIMIRSSQEIIRELISFGVDFATENGELAFTREGGHSRPRILFHEDITGEEITKKLLEEVRRRDNISILEHVTMIDLVCQDNICYGIVCRTADGGQMVIEARETVLACGGVGGLYEHSTNFPHLTGDGLAIAIKNGVELENIDYVQIHPTTLYSKKPGRRFLISESVRGEGAVLYDAHHQRFVDELLPRDLLTAAIHQQMEKDGMPYVWLSMEKIPEAEIKSHFPNIYKRCLEEGYDVTKECIPVVPAQHYFMGGIHVDKYSHTSMDQLYAVGETSCNGVHGANRLASNSLLESLVFAKRAAGQIQEQIEAAKAREDIMEIVDFSQYTDYEAIREKYRNAIIEETERMKKEHEQSNHNEAKCG
ncbi:L-aspartate oxidase [Ruminococcus sp. OA3]|uniref:L-aspartate oxidase n=1 Tax=Ruminococcus sp. OA3 TaxID=2914164 RepID=UPI001F066F02|nr:L-aspartate oxidase [Ruminococcus sp. OA3]MCH1983985.1 L-aspartate oxidase [Ruminococcus sp. OA3]